MKVKVKVAFVKAFGAQSNTQRQFTLSSSQIWRWFWTSKTEHAADESCRVGGANLTLKALFCFTIISPYATNEITAACDVT